MLEAIGWMSQSYDAPYVKPKRRFVLILVESRMRHRAPNVRLSHSLSDQPGYSFPAMLLPTVRNCLSDPVPVRMSKRLEPSTPLDISLKPLK